VGILFGTGAEERRETVENGEEGRGSREIRGE
jgi:hypothetical protein